LKCRGPLGTSNATVDIFRDDVGIGRQYENPIDILRNPSMLFAGAVPNGFTVGANVTASQNSAHRIGLYSCMLSATDASAGFINYAVPANVRPGTWVTVRFFYKMVSGYPVVKATFGATSLVKMFGNGITLGSTGPQFGGDTTYWQILEFSWQYRPDSGYNASMSIGIGYTAGATGDRMYITEPQIMISPDTPLASVILATGTGLTQAVAHGLRVKPRKYSVTPDATGGTVSDVWADAININFVAANGAAVTVSAEY
jgi:hypothetical protein